jgi:ParB family chromosome partitioning protein
MGLNRSTVTNTLRLLRLPSSVQEMLNNREVTYGHARALLGLQSEAAQIKLARLVFKQGLSVRQVEIIVSGRQLARSKEKPTPTSNLDANTRAAVLELERTLGTRVRVVGNDQRGKIEISYFSREDLNRIYEWISRQ